MLPGEREEVRVKGLGGVGRGGGERVGAVEERGADVVEEAGGAEDAGVQVGAVGGGGVGVAVEDEGGAGDEEGAENACEDGEGKVMEAGGGHWGRGVLDGDFAVADCVDGWLCGGGGGGGAVVVGGLGELEEWGTKHRIVLFAVGSLLFRNFRGNKKLHFLVSAIEASAELYPTGRSFDGGHDVGLRLSILMCMKYGGRGLDN